jgi:REP element-mobilizing transposase RayT
MDPPGLPQIRARKGARIAWASQANCCYHVTNRGNPCAQVFHKPADYASFVELIGAARRRRPMRVLGHALMPNDFHLILWPIADGDLST